MQVVGRAGELLIRLANRSQTLYHDYYKVGLKEINIEYKKIKAAVETIRLEGNAEITAALKKLRSVICEIRNVAL